MTPNMTPEMKAAIKEAVKEAIQPLEARFEKTTRMRNLALITAVLCLVAAAFSVGYAVQSRKALNNQVETNRVVVCANARSTALAFREPEVSSSGRKEGRDHFLNRLVGQRETLIAVATLSCPDIRGFDTFEYLRGKALAEIEAILLQQAPNKARDLGIGIGEEGLGVDSPSPAGVPDPTTSPDGSPESPRATATPDHHQTGGNNDTGDPNPAGSGDQTDNGDGGSEPQPVPPGEPLPDVGGGSSEREPDPEQEPEPETKPNSGKILPGIVGPVEDGVCRSILGKLVCG